MFLCQHCPLAELAPFSPWCLLVLCIYRQLFTSPLHFHYAGINKEAILIPSYNQTAPFLCSSRHHCHWSPFLEYPQSPHHILEEASLPQKVSILPASWVTFASLLRSLKETPVAVGSSSAVLPSTSHELTANILVMDPSVFTV